MLLLSSPRTPFLDNFRVADQPGVRPLEIGSAGLSESDLLNSQEFGCRLWCCTLAFEQRRDIYGGQRNPASFNPSCIEERRSTCRRADGIGTFRAAAEIFVVSRERDNSDFGHFFHGENFVAIPIRAGYF